MQNVTRKLKVFLCCALAAIMLMGPMAQPVMAAKTKVVKTYKNVIVTAYYPAKSKMDGGYYDMKGKKLDPSKPTIAASMGLKLAYGTKVRLTVSGKNMAKYSMTYTVRDRMLGSGRKNWVDILVSNAKAAQKIGRRTGTLEILK